MWSFPFSWEGAITHQICIIIASVCTRVTKWPLESDGVRTMTVAANKDGKSHFKDLLQLALLPGIGPKTLTDLLEHFGTAQAVLQASESDLQQVSGIGPQLSHRITQADLHIQPDQVIEHCDQAGISIVTWDDPDYPRPLRQIDTAPPVLFIRGKWIPRDALSIAIVGTRHATHYGKSQTEKIASSLAHRGITVISGLARGIDAAAHQSTLRASGRTLAVLGCGHDHLYPAEHLELSKQIAEAGAVISEFPPWTRPRGPLFPQRNRIISGLCLAVLVIEAADRSGALVTARHAMEQGRDVFALPGSVASRVSRGCHALIRDGAKLIECADQIIEELGPLAEAIPRTTEEPTELRHPAELTLNAQEKSVLNAIGTEATSVDTVIARPVFPSNVF